MDDLSGSGRLGRRLILVALLGFLGSSCREPGSRPVRTLETRLTSQIAYRECPSVAAPEGGLGPLSCASLEPASPAARPRRLTGSALERIATVLSWKTDAETLAHAAKALASPLAGVPESQRLLALGAVEQGLARARGDASLLVDALEHTQRSLAAAPGSEAAWFNRAVIAGDLGLCRVARRQWRDYRSHFSGSPWADEARRREKALPCRASAPKRVDAMTEALERHLPDWLAAEEVDPVRAAGILAGMEQTADTLARQGELGLSDLVQELQTADPAKRAAFLAYVRGRADFLGEAYEDAARELERALPLLRSSGSMLYPWCEIWRAGLALSAGRFEEARHHLDAVRTSPGLARSPRTRGRFLWAEGLIDLRDGRLETAHARFGDAERAFAQGGDRLGEAAVRTLTAESLQHLGLLRESWHARILAMRELQGPRSPFSFHNALVDGAELAAASGAEEVADAFLAEGAALAQETGVVNSRIEVLLWQGDVWHQRGHPEAAALRYGSALRAVRAHGEMDASVRGRFEARARLGLGATAGGLDKSADADLREALAYFRANGSTVQEVRVLRAQAERQRRNGKTAAAAATLGEAIGVLRRMRRDVRDERVEVEFVDSVQEVFDAALELALQEGRPVAALDLLEQARGLEAGGERAAGGSHVERYLATAARSAALRAPVVVVYALTGEAFAWWTIDGKEMRHGREDAAPVRRAAQALLDRLGERGGAREAHLGPLARLLLGQPLRGVAADRPLIFIPDRELQRIPFAALRDSRTGVRLIETRAISLRPDLASVFAPRSLRKPGPRRADWSVLAVGNPAFDRPRFATLAPLPGAGREAGRVAALYGRNALFLSAESATPGAARHALAGRQVLHLAAHAQAGRDPFHDVFVLAPEPGTSGLVTSRELVPDTSSLQVVVLSACNTMGGRASRAGSLIGLARPFIARQVPVTVGTLWDVDDGLLGDLMIDFHQGLRQGLAASESLRQAQLDFLKHHRDPVSLDWAAVEIVGDLPAEEAVFTQ